MDKPKIRIIPKLEIKGMNVIKGIRMEGLRKVGKPDIMSKKYFHDLADEILFIDTVASLYNRNNLHALVTSVSEEISLPLCVGGGIRSLEDAKNLLRCGADKVSVNTAAIKNPGIITNLAKAFGSQSIVASVQAKRKNANSWEAFYNNGREKSNLEVTLWIKELVDRGAGEILLTSIDQDGTKLGPDFKLIETVKNSINLPLVVSGGIRDYSDIIKINKMGVYAVAISNILHFNLFNIKEIKKSLIENNINTRI